MDKLSRVEKEIGTETFFEPLWINRNIRGVFSLANVNLGGKKKEKSEYLDEYTPVVKAIDIETNGKQIFLGAYDGDSYQYSVFTNVHDLEESLSMFGDVNFFYGDYDLPVMFSPLASTLNERKKALRGLADSFFYSRNFTLIKYKNSYSLLDSTGKKKFFINLLQYYSDSLYNAYIRFYELIKKNFPISHLSEKELEEWKEDKSKRADFDKLDLNDRQTVEEIARYNLLDVKATYQLATILPQLFPFESTMKSLPSNAIEYIISNTQEENYVYHLENGDLIRGLPYNPVIASTLLSLYKGGLFDSNELGVFDKVKKYDVNSMYPTFMAKLPSLQFEGVENQFIPNEKPMMIGTQEVDAKEVYVYHGCFEQGGKLVSSKVDDKLMRVGEFCGSFFDFELTENGKELSQRIKPKGNIITLKFKIEKKHVFEPVIKDLYGKRLELKKQKNPLEKVYKLILNSSYGKFGERLLNNAKFQNVIYASMITALGRTYIVNSDQDAVSYLTDSIITYKELPSELVGDELGRFKLEGEGSAKVIGNGIYVLEDPEEKMVKTRGFRISEELGEKVINVISENLVKGKIVRVKVSQKLMFRSIFDLRLKADGVIGLINDIEKVMSPLNVKQRYVFSGNWKGLMLKDERDAIVNKKSYEKMLKNSEVIEISE